MKIFFSPLPFNVFFPWEKVWYLLSFSHSRIFNCVPTFINRWKQSNYDLYVFFFFSSLSKSLINYVQYFFPQTSNNNGNSFKIMYMPSFQNQNTTRMPTLDSCKRKSLVQINEDKYGTITTSSSWNLVHILERRYLCNLQEENFNNIIKYKYDTTLNEDLRYKGKSRYLRDRILVVLMWAVTDQI